jgi:hypothetical protein
MFCTRCGIQLPEEANFCWKCGTSIGGTVAAPSSVAYEFCQIARESAGGNRDRWSARVGSQVIGASRVFQADLGTFDAMLVPLTWGGDSKIKHRLATERQQALLELISALTAKGWEPLTVDSEGQIRTMRRVKK